MMLRGLFSETSLAGLITPLATALGTHTHLQRSGASQNPLMLSLGALRGPANSMCRNRGDVHGDACHARSLGRILLDKGDNCEGGPADAANVP